MQVSLITAVRAVLAVLAVIAISFLYITLRRVKRTERSPQIDLEFSTYRNLLGDLRLFYIAGVVNLLGFANYTAGAVLEIEVLKTSAKLYSVVFVFMLVVIFNRWRRRL